MASLESRLSANHDEIVTAEEIAWLTGEFEAIAAPLRGFVGGQ